MPFFQAKVVDEDRDERDFDDIPITQDHTMEEHARTDGSHIDLVIQPMCLSL
jgi:hypothetical protein